MCRSYPIFHTPLLIPWLTLFFLWSSADMRGFDALKGKEYTLADVLLKEGESMMFTVRLSFRAFFSIGTQLNLKFDPFQGDIWWHDIKLEKMVSREESNGRVELMDGGGACPPEVRSFCLSLLPPSSYPNSKNYSSFLSYPITLPVTSSGTKRPTNDARSVSISRSHDNPTTATLAPSNDSARSGDLIPASSPSPKLDNESQTPSRRELLFLSDRNPTLNLRRWVGSR